MAAEDTLAGGDEAEDIAGDDEKPMDDTAAGTDTPVDDTAAGEDTPVDDAGAGDDMPLSDAVSEGKGDMSGIERLGELDLVPDDSQVANSDNITTSDLGESGDQISDPCECTGTNLQTPDSYGNFEYL